MGDVIEDDHTRLLALAKAALVARDNAAQWRRSPEKAAGHHAACCDALWYELERQVIASLGEIPTLEHPTVTQRKLAKRLRSEIIAAVQTSVSETLEEISDGAYDWEDP